MRLGARTTQAFCWMSSKFHESADTKGNKTPMRSLRRNSIATFLLLALAMVWISTAALGHAQQSASPQTPSSLPPQPVPLAHLYWHFLIYQNYLDNLAATMTTQGQDGAWLRNDFQRRLGFSDADFAPIRASGVRLSSELHALDAQAAAIHARGVSASNSAQLQALVAQRETYISAEIATLKQALSPEKITTFETFITQFFAPKQIMIQIPTASGQATPSVVQP